MVGLSCFFIYLVLGIFEIEESSPDEVDSRKTFGVGGTSPGVGKHAGSALFAKSVKGSQELFEKSFNRDLRG